MTSTELTQPAAHTEVPAEARSALDQQQYLTGHVQRQRASHPH